MSRARDIANLLSTDSPLIDNAPDALNTLNELAAALGDDENFATTVTNSLAGKVSKSGDTITVTSASATPLTLKGASGQTADLFQGEDENNFDLYRLTNTGIAIHNSETTTLAIQLNNYTNDSNSRHFQFQKHRGTFASPAVVQNGDSLGLIRFFGYSGAASTVREAPRIASFVDGEPDTSGDTTDMPGMLVFLTTTNGESSPSERMRIKNDGAVLIGTSTPGSASTGDLVVNGGVFLGGSAAGNELNDYEEGTWTPEYTFGTSGSVTHDIQSGDYMRINDKVFIWARLRTDAISSPTGSVRVSGLPFNTSATISFNYGMGGVVTYAASFGGDRPSVVSIDTASVDYANLRFRGSASGDTNVLQGSDMGSGANNNDLEFNAWYWAV